MAQQGYSIGIDLGTTNCSVAFVDDKGQRKRAITALEIPQIVGWGEIVSRNLLPSFLFFPRDFEIPGRGPEPALPWDTGSDATVEGIVGDFARFQASRLTGRVVSSAKSWLCHPRVDRRASILPWGAGNDERTISPLDASSRYLRHLKCAWNHLMAYESESLLMESLEPVLTVPASFDAVARELTVEAAKMAGYANFVLLEEPQAAFYCWLSSHESTWRRILKGLSMVLVCDVGGGTTDFTLIKVDRSGDELALRRIAVGEHLLLGGDNMDIALAGRLETQIEEGKKLDSQRWAQLCQECRVIKEKALGGDDLQRYSISLAGRGSKLIGDSLRVDIGRDEIERLILDGFLPPCRLDEAVLRQSTQGLKEWGLPYASDPAITRHLAAFLRRHLKEGEFPDALLFNGGALKSKAIRGRIIESLEEWSQERGITRTTKLKILESSDLDLAVAQGASYFGLVRRGKGCRIGGGTPRSFYVGIDLDNSRKDAGPSLIDAICLIPKDLLTETEVEITDREFSLLLGKPVSFPLYSSTSRGDDRVGEIFSLADDDLEHLPPLYLVLESRDGKEREIPVHLRAWITEIGTLELWCVSRDRQEKWKLQFALTGPKTGETPITTSSKMGMAVDPVIVKSARELVSATFKRKQSQSSSLEVKPRGLLYKLEEISREKREAWSTAFNRETFDELLAVMGRRRSSPQHEASWLNMAGFCGRPGFGYPLDDWRVSEVWQIFAQWLQFSKDPQCRLEWWIFWRRLAGGLNQAAQEEIFGRISPYFLPGLKHLKTFPGPPPSKTESLEVLRMAACLEKIPQDQKLTIGNYIMDTFIARQPTYAHFWLIARLGTRVPFAGSIHTVIDREAAQRWIDRILTLPWSDAQGPLFALARLSMLTGDRARDIDEEQRQRVITRIRGEKADESLLLPLLEVIEESAKSQELIFGESLPPGLILRENQDLP
jgi:molecular chaperone DnaK (HSP70)